VKLVAFLLDVGRPKADGWKYRTERW